MKKFKAAKVLFCITAVLMVVLGILTLKMPGEALLTLGLLLGCGFVITGIFCLIAFFGAKDKIFRSGWTLVQGILDVIIGIFLLVNWKVAVIAIPFIVAFWMLFSGIARIAGSIDLKGLGLKNWWLVLITGILAIIVSVLILFYPVAGAFATVLIIGIYLIIYGILIFVETVTTRSLKI